MATRFPRTVLLGAWLVALQANAQLALTPSAQHFSCGDWVQARTTRSEHDEGIMKIWTWGYISGLANGGQRYRSVQLPSGATVSAWVDKYCRDEPLANIARAGEALMDELAKPPQAK